MSSHTVDKYLTDSTLDYLRNAYRGIVHIPSLQKALFQINHPFSNTLCQQKSMMIDRLIDMSAEIIDSIWLNKQKPTKNPILPTKVFIREILQRSRATYSMLQLALFYIFRIKKLVSSSTHCLVSCSRRMFLAALILASKYLHDRNYRTQTWAKIASLSVAEITASELVFLKLIDYRLYVSKPLYDKWVSLLYQHIQKQDSIQQHKDNNFASTTQVKSAVPFICPLTKAGDDDHSNNGDDDSCSEISLPNGVCSSSSSSAAASPLNTPPLLPNNTIKKRQLEEQEDWPASKHICLEK